MNKHRNAAGKVVSSDIVSVETLRINDGGITICCEPIGENDHIRIASDDMLDLGRSAEVDDKELDIYYPNAVFKMVVATHAVTSLGVKLACDRTNANVVFFGNTLNNQDPGMKDHRVRVVDMAPAVADTIFGKV
jgi:phosphoribosylpyrophosphate synthetase